MFFKGKFKVEGNEIIGFKDGEYDFVLMPDGELRIGHGHAHLSGNKMNLPAAGGITIYNNKIENINGQSGHYRPENDELELIQDYFTDIGLW